MDKSDPKKNTGEQTYPLPGIFFRVRLRTGCRRIVWTVS